MEWALPGWEASSASCASDWSDWSDGAESSSAGSTQHQRFYRDLRARRGPGDRGSGDERSARDLRALHALFQRRRQQSEARGGGDGDEGQQEATRGLELAEQQEDSEGKGRSEVDAEREREAERQWLLLLADKVLAVAEEFESGPTQAFYNTVARLAERADSGNQANERLEEHGRDDCPQGDAAWTGVKKMAAGETAERVEKLDRAVGRLTKAVRAHSVRQMEYFDQSISKLQDIHNSRVQRVVDEAIDELKAVRGRYRKKEARLENELRMAYRSVDEWKHRATHGADATQHLTTIENLQCQLDAAHSQMEADRNQYETDLLRVRQMLELAYAEREDVISRPENDHNNAASSLEQTRKISLTDSKHVDVDTRAVETQTIDSSFSHYANDISDYVRQQVLEQELQERVQEVEQRYEDEFESMKRIHDEQVSDLSRRIQEAMVLIETKHTKTRAIETQTIDSSFNQDDNDARVEELTRRCRALEKLLNKKFEDASQSLASSGICASCHSENASLRLSNASGGSRTVDSRLSSRHRGPPTVEETKARTRMLLSTSCSSLEDALFPEAGDGEVTAATEEQTTMHAVEMWDSASFTSVDSIDESAVGPHPLPPRVLLASQAPSTQEMAALARKLKRFAAASSSSIASSQREPDPEIAGTPRKSDVKRDFAAQFAAAKRARPPLKGRTPPTSTGFSSFDDLLQSIASRRSNAQ